METTKCHCGHSMDRHILVDSFMYILWTQCLVINCNCTEFHQPEDCELPTHERIQE